MNNAKLVINKVINALNANQTSILRMEHVILKFLTVLIKLKVYVIHAIAVTTKVK